MKQNPSWEAKRPSAISLHFMKPEGSLPHSQSVRHRPYPELDQSSPSFQSHFLKIRFNIILRSARKSYKRPVSIEIPHQNFQHGWSSFAWVWISRLVFQRSNTNHEGEEIVDALGKDGSASMPEQVKRPNPWRKMMMMMMKLFDCI
jgi:hypothetical protein